MQFMRNFAKVICYSRNNEGISAIRIKLWCHMCKLPVQNLQDEVKCSLNRKIFSGDPAAMSDGENENGLPNSEEEEEEEIILQFLDSMDTYLTLFQSLSSTLRQGWVDLASARHSMGPSRINSSLFDLQLHSAATTLQVDIPYAESESGDPMAKQPCFTLSSWSSSHDRKCDSGQTEFGEEHQKKAFVSQLRHRVPSNFTGAGEQDSESNDEPLNVDDQIQKERLKALSVFGTLVSPKLRAAQNSFETALETLINIANVRSSMLSAYAHIRQRREGVK